MVLSSTGSGAARPDPIQQLYQTFGDLNDATDGPTYLSEYSSDLNWPERGIYVFFTSDSDLERDPPSEWQVARIGTVGVSEGSSNTLRNRMRQHKGNESGKYGEGGGNHRGSIMRLHIGRAMIERDGLDQPYWGQTRKQLPDDLETTELRKHEHPLEQRVSEYIQDLPFLILNVPGEPSPTCNRAEIERQLISTFSFYHRTHDIQTQSWLGRHSPKPEIYQSRLWNINHVEEFSSPSVYNDVERYIDQTQPLTPDN